MTDIRRATIAADMLATGGRSSGFDYLRLALAIAVVLVHTPILCGGPDAENQLWQTWWLGPLLKAILPMFFALSGFLVVGSLSRSHSLTTFLGLRAIRIYPALCVDVLLSAFILGPLLTTWSLGAYFSDREFWHYLINVIGRIHYVLPGVFADNPYPNIVNGQLWTIPVELYCYVWMAVLALAGVMRRRWLAPVAAVVIVVVELVLQRASPGGLAPIVTGPSTGAMLIVSFLAGASIWLFRERLPSNFPTLAGSAIASIALFGWIPFGDFMAPFTVAYMTVILGLKNPRRVLLLKGADYSYGIYLYGYAIQQALAAAGIRTLAMHGLLSLVIATLFAALSWHMVEKPALRMRKWFGASGTRTARGPSPQPATAQPVAVQSPGVPMI